jgi:hypothetical protein
MTMNKRGLIAIVLVLAAAALVPACLFDTREANPPAETGDQITLESPEKPFLAISKSLNETLTDTNYERAISQQFIFSPTLADSLDQTFVGTGVFDNWTKPVEMNVLGLLLSDAQQIHVVFTPTILTQNSTFVRWRTPYVLDVIDKSAPTDTLHYQGVAQIDVRRENGNWRITFWNEVETVAGYATWGYLRGILRLRLNP